MELNVIAPVAESIEIVLASIPESEYFNTLEFAVVATTVPIEVRFSLTMNELGEVIIGTTASTPPPPQAFRKIRDIINNCYKTCSLDQSLDDSNTRNETLD
ncbi:MAG: hypothetical protein HOM88_05680 [Hellea sp.]|nr:hypothetical protein [Hellea sp.]